MGISRWLVTGVDVEAYLDIANALQYLWGIGGIAMSMSPDEVRALRERFDESRGEFAARVGVSAMTVLNWEKGATRPTRLARLRLREIACHTLPGVEA